MKKILPIFLGILTAIGGFVDMGDLVANSAVGARFGLGRPRPAEALAAVHRLIVDERVVAAMHRDQQFPLALGAAL